MNKVLNWMLRSYHHLLRLYPSSFRLEFCHEMGIVFNQLLADTAPKGILPLIYVYLREIRDIPLQLLVEYWFFMQNVIVRRMQMSENNNWRIGRPKVALWAATPPLVIALGIVLKELALWPVYYKVASWRMYLAIGLYASAMLLLIVIGALAVLRRLPDWGYTWAGAGLMSGTLLLKTAVEEIAEESSQAFISPAAEKFFTISICLIGLALIVAAAWRGWPQAGLVSIGFAVTVGLNLFDAMSYAPFNRYDLALLAGISGVVMGYMIYAYVTRGLQVRIATLVLIWLLNLGASLLLIHIYKLHSISFGEPDLLIPLTILLTGVILVGPVIGALGGTVRRRLARV